MMMMMTTRMRRKTPDEDDDNCDGIVQPDTIITASNRSSKVAMLDGDNNTVHYILIDSWLWFETIKHAEEVVDGDGDGCCWNLQVSISLIITFADTSISRHIFWLQLVRSKIDRGLSLLLGANFLVDHPGGREREMSDKSLKRLGIVDYTTTMVSRSLRTTH